MEEGFACRIMKCCKSYSLKELSSQDWVFLSTRGVGGWVALFWGALVSTQNVRSAYQTSWLYTRATCSWYFFSTSITIYLTEALVCIPKCTLVLLPYFCYQLGKEHHLKCKYSTSLFTKSKPLPENTEDQTMQSLAYHFTSIFVWFWIVEE